MTDRRHTGWDKKQFIPNFIVSTFTQLLASFISFLISYFILKKYNQPVLGELVLLISIAQVFVFLTNWSLVAVQKLGTEEFLESDNVTTIFSNRLLLFLFNFGCVALLYFIFSPLFSKYLPLSPTGNILAAVYGFVLALNIHFYAGFNARKMLRMQGFLLLIEKLLIIAALFLLVSTNNISLERLAIIYIAAGLMISCVCLALSRKNLSLKWNSAIVKKIALFSLPLLPYTIVGFFTSNYSDSFFINKYLETADIALYSIAYQFNGIWLQIPTILGAIILPLFITSNKHESEETTLTYISSYGVTLNFLWSVASFILVAALILVLPLIYNAFTPAFFTSLYIFIISTSVAFSTGVFFSPFLLSRNILKISLPLAALSAVCNIVGNILLIPVYGIVGCALSTVIFAFLNSLILTIFMNQRFKVDLRKMLLNNFLIAAAVILALLKYDLLMISGIFSGLFILLVLLNLRDAKKMYNIIVGYLRKNAVSNPS